MLVALCFYQCNRFPEHGLEAHLNQGCIEAVYRMIAANCHIKELPAGHAIAANLIQQGLPSNTLHQPTLLLQLPAPDGEVAGSWCWYEAIIGWLQVWCLDRCCGTPWKLIKGTAQQASEPGEVVVCGWTATVSAVVWVTLMSPQLRASAEQSQEDGLQPTPPLPDKLVHVLHLYSTVTQDHRA